MEIEILKLSLISSLYYVPEKDSDPFEYREGDGEKLFCFELDEAQAHEFEPDKTKIPGNAVFSGKADKGKSGQPRAEFPQGNYLFAQKRELLSRNDIVDMAVRIQQEGLWQRLNFGRKLYLRYLFEDGCYVTQLFRPYA